MTWIYYLYIINRYDKVNLDPNEKHVYVNTFSVLFIYISIYHAFNVFSFEEYIETFNIA